MKKLFIIFGIILFIPFCVNAETLTYNVCDEGCKYNRGKDVQTAINSIDDLSDKQIVININGDYFDFDLGSANNVIKSIIINFTNTHNDYSKSTIFAKDLVINGNGVTFDHFTTSFACDSITIKDTQLPNDSTIYTNNTNYLNIQNTKIDVLFLQYLDLQTYEFLPEEVTLSINGNSLDNVNSLWVSGNMKMEQESLSNTTLVNAGGITNLYNCNIKRVLNYPENPNTKTNIYNSSLKSLRYKIFKSGEDDEEFNAFMEYINNRDENILNYDFYGFYFPEYNINVHSNIYLDKNARIKTSESLNLNSYLDYYTDDKEISYTIDDENIAKIENKELIGLKPGSTKVQVTTDEGHVIYNIDLTVEPANTGTVEKKETETKNYVQADFSSNDLNSVIPLTNEEQVLKDSGKNVEVFLEVKDVSKTIAPEEKNLIEEKLSSNEEIGTYLDVSLFKQVEGEEASKIEKTNGNISVSLTVPENLINKDNKIKRTYYILRLHDGVVDKLDTNFDGKVLTFETDRFSTYALTYKDEVISSVNNPKTGDNIIKYMGILFGSILLIVFIQISKLRKE